MGEVSKRTAQLLVLENPPGLIGIQAGRVHSPVRVGVPPIDGHWLKAPFRTPGGSSRPAGRRERVDEEGLAHEQIENGQSRDFGSSRRHGQVVSRGLFEFTPLFRHGLNDFMHVLVSPQPVAVKQA